MNEINENLVDEALDFVMNLFDEKLTKDYVFHSKDHTKDVLVKSRKIGTESGFSTEECNLLELSAIFHDSGYINGFRDHEIISAQIANDFLVSEGISSTIIDQVLRAIKSTEVPQNPGDKISKALCDADLMHLSGDDYFEQMELLREEWKLTGRADLSELDFHKQSVEFFNKHSYHTRYGKTVLEKLKDENLKRIKKIISLLSE